MIILKHGRFISGTRIYRAGEILPDTPGVQGLVAQGLAETVEKLKNPKSAKKREAGPSQENAEGNP